MRTHFCLAATAVLVLNLAGCGWIGSSPSGMAVVDLDEIARQVGASSEITQALKAREENLNGQLQALRANYVQQLEAKKIEFGEDLSEEETTQLVAMGRQVNLNLAQAQQNAQGNLSAHRAALIAQFREQVAPVARQIAASRGLAVVVPKNDGLLLSVDDSVNITSEVAAALKPVWRPIAPAQPTVAASPGAGQPQPAPGPSSGPVQPATHHEPLPQRR